MADNPYVNKVEYAGQTLMDITDTTAEAGDVRSGEVFYAANGARSVGTMSAGGNTSVWVGTSDTAAGTRDKAVTSAGVTEYKTGDVFVITFTNAQDYNGSPRLNINSLGAKTVRKLVGTSASRYQWQAGETLIFVYDGTYMLAVNNAFAGTTYYGLTKLTSSCTSTSSGLAITASALNAYSERMIAGVPVYNAESTYEVGDKVRYSWYIYECNTAITEAEAWNAEHWDQLPALQTQVDTLSDDLHPKNELNSVSEITTLIQKSDNAYYALFRASATLNQTLTGVNKNAVILVYKASPSSNYIEYLSLDYDGDARSGSYNISTNTRNTHQGSIRIDSFTGTSSASGNVNKTFDRAVVVLSAWSPSSGYVITPYPSVGADGSGKDSWWFHVCSDSADNHVIASTSMTIYYTFMYVNG